MIEEETLRGFGTRAVRGGKKYLDPQTGCVNVPIITSTTYGQAAPGIKKGLEDPCTYGGGYEYSRTANPTRGTLEQTLADLEFGKHALTYASGLASITAVTHLVKTNEQILCIDDVYGGTQRYFRHIVTPNYGINVTFLDLTDLELVRSKMNQDTRMIWVETPTNPTLKMADIQELAKIAHEYNAFLVVDNTFLTPYFQNPLKLGADIVIHSITKYLSGHSDVIMGCAITNNKDIFTKLKYIQNTMGAIPSPFDCYLVMRGIKTLHLRMKEHAKNAQLLAEFMEKHPLVQKVYYPGLPSHPQYHIGKKQINEGGFGGMITFYIKGGKKEANTFLEKLEIFTCAESLGGVESLAESPAIMTHASVNEQQRRELGISDTLIRLSVGIEDINDIIHDIDQALNATTKQ